MTDRNSVLEEVLDKISDLAGEALDNGDAGKGDHWYYRIHGLEDAAHAVRALRTPVEPVLPSEASTPISPQEQGIREALQKCAEAMRMQEMRAKGELHISSFSFQLIWNAALNAADRARALSSVGRGGGGK